MEQTAKLDYAASPGGAAAPSLPEDGSGIAELLRLLWRQKLLVVTTVFLITGLSVVIALHIPPRYTSEARMIIKPAGEKQISEGFSLAAPTIFRSMRSGVYGEIEVMRSHRLIEKVVRRLSLFDDPEFNPSLRKPGILALFADFNPITLYRSWVGRAPEAPRSAEENSALEMRAVIDSFGTRMKITPPALSNVVRISIESNDPIKSSRIVNAYTETYIADQRQRKIHANIQKGSWMDERLAAMHVTMLKSERRLIDFQATNNLNDTGRTALIEQNFAEISRQLIVAKGKYAEKNVRLAQIKKLMKSPEKLSSVREIRTSTVIRRLREVEETLIRRAAELETRFGERHPKMINIRVEIKTAKRRIAEEQERIVAELQNELRSAGARVATLQEKLEDRGNQRGGLAQNRVKLLQLRREARADRRIYESFMSHSKQASERDSLDGNQVDVISPGHVPSKPSYPRKGLIVSIGFLVSLVLGGFIAFILEQHNGFRTKEQIERLMNTVALGGIPKSPGWGKRSRSISDLVLEQGHSPYIEAVRSLRTSLMISDRDHPPKIILVASALPGEGKTSLSVSLARLAAASEINGKVLLIDCDLRKPSVAKEMKIEPEKGLFHLFSGQASLEEIITVEEKSRLHTILATHHTPNPPELLNSSHMRDLLKRVSGMYDTVILDSPALSQVSDGLVLAHLADATIFVVQWDATPRAIAMESFRMLTAVKACIAGTVMQKVNPRRSSYYYSYSYSYAYEDRKR